MNNDDSVSSVDAPPLWQWDELVAAAAGLGDGAPGSGAINGISIDTRTIAPGDLFVALSDQRDGHEFVTAAFGAGATAALVSQDYHRQPGDGALVRVDDPLAGLEAIGIAARTRTGARILAVTGSVGKTGSKEALRACLSMLGKTHASEKSYNNHWGVPLTLARMPADTEYGVFEIGMNHANEITPLVAMVRPHVVFITTVEPVHLGYFNGIEDIAQAKAEIFSGLEVGGTAILNRDNAFYEFLKDRAMARGARVLPFGEHGDAVALLVRASFGPEGSQVQALIEGSPVKYAIGAPGAHHVQNSLGVLASIKALGGDVTACLEAFRDMAAPVGRGAKTIVALPEGDITLIDESYNANPASMRAALGILGSIPREQRDRRIVVLGDMLELGAEASRLHRDLKNAIEAADVDLVFACGEHMRGLFEDLPRATQAKWSETSAHIETAIADEIRAGDAVMVKGSLGSKMGRIVQFIKKMDCKCPDQAT